MIEIKVLSEQGFVVVKNAVNIDAIESALKCIQEFKNTHTQIVSPNADEFGLLTRVVNLHLAIPEVCELFAKENRAISVCDSFFKNWPWKRSFKLFNVSVTGSPNIFAAKSTVLPYSPVAMSFHRFSTM